jgi:hypothetical protein
VLGDVARMGKSALEVCDPSGQVVERLHGHQAITGHGRSSVRRGNRGSDAGAASPAT